MRIERTRRRITFINPVHFGTSVPPEHSSFITEFSDKGVHIKTNTVYTPGTKLYLTINTPVRNYSLEGVVAWAKRVPPMVEPYVKNGMGIKFLHLNPEIADLYKERVEAERSTSPIL